MHHFLPLARLFEHLGDEGFLEADEVSEMLADARMLNQQGFSTNHIIEALLCWKFFSHPTLRAEVARFQENEEEYHRLSQLRIPKAKLLELMWPYLNGERNDIQTAFAGIADETLLSSNQAIYHIPPHHPKAIDALVRVFLGHAKADSPAMEGWSMDNLVTRRMLRHWLVSSKLTSFEIKELLLARLMNMGNGHGDRDVFTLDDDVIRVLLEGEHDLQQAALTYEWPADARHEDHLAVEYYQRHTLHRPVKPEPEPA